MRYLLIASLLVLATPGTLAAASPSPVPSTAPSASPSAAPAGPPGPGELRINELLPNPVGTDTGNEWIELANVSEYDLTIGGVQVVRLSGTTLATAPASTVIKAGNVLLLTPLSGTLVNGGDTIILKSGQTELDRITYEGTGQEGWSWSRLSATEGGWTSIPTPGVVNPGADSNAGGDSGMDGTGAIGGTSGAATAASTRAAAATAKAGASKDAAKRPVAKKLAAAGPDGSAYLVLPVLGIALATLYGYVRRKFS